MARSRRVRAERRADVRVVQVVAVPEHNGGALGRRQPVREVLELGERGAARLAGDVRELRVRARAPMLVDHDPACDRERPGAEVVGVAELRVRAEGTQKRLLERIVRAVTAEAAHEEPIDLLLVLVVETLERRQRHVDIL